MNKVTIGKTNLPCGSLALLLGVMLTPWATAQANDWSFNLVGSPAATLDESSAGAPGETIHMTGGGTFNAEQGIINASGSAVVFGATDHPAPPEGPTLRGTWQATEIVSFTPDEGSNKGKVGGTLVMIVQFELALGAIHPTATVTVMEDGIMVADFGPDKEEYEPVEESGGAFFHEHGQAEP